ncbi:MAG: hypothetical protein SXA11_17790 [Cyanobacteriota bacterium]|nr:hypothetical protein [Cyanobacteriota bacterium]
MNEAKERNLVGSLIGGVLQGGLWGIFWGASILALLLAFPKHYMTLLSGLILGVFWCVVFGLLWKYLMAKEGDSAKSYVSWGIFWGLLLGCALSGVALLLITRNLAPGINVVIGAIIGAIFGVLWNIFQPPIWIPEGRLWGIKGAFLGGIWGAFLGSIVGILMGLFLLVRNQFMPGFPALDEALQLFLFALIFGAGNGSIGGFISGTVFGGIILSRPLPMSLEMSGKVGALLGAMWGCFLCSIALGAIGALLSVINPDLFYDFGFRNQINLLTGTILGAGLGALWGILSGGIWGGIGKW